MTDDFNIAGALGVEQKKTIDEMKPHEVIKRPKAFSSDYHITQKIGDTWVRCGFAFVRDDGKGYNLFIRDMTSWKFRKLYMLKNKWKDRDWKGGENGGDNKLPQESENADS